MKDKKRRTYGFLTGLLLILSVCLTSCGNQGQTDSGKDSNTQSGTKVAAEDHSAEEKGSDSESYVTVDDVPAYSGEPYVEVNDNQPEFTEEELTTVSYEDYSELDELGRCQSAEACIGQDLMPTEARESISSVKPTGWKNKSYDTVDGGYVYNRCHLIGFQLTGENANRKNLMTGTRYLNVEGMLPFENEVCDYIKKTDHHVLYRVTPIYDGDNLVANGVQIEAYSVEDKGQGISFNVYCYNVQPGIKIDYKTGDSSRLKESIIKEYKASEDNMTYILNVNTHKFHRPTCSSVKKMKDSNKIETKDSRDVLLQQGYLPCKNCNP